MTRLLIIVGFIVAAAAAFSGYLLFLAPNLDTAERGILAAATVQAATGLLVVAVTWELATIARTSLATAGRQTDAAAEANRHATDAFVGAEVERRLSNLPFISVRITDVVSGPDGVTFNLVLRNVTDHPALHVRVDARGVVGWPPGGEGSFEILMNEIGSHHPVIGPREQVSITQSFRHVLGGDEWPRNLRDADRTWVAYQPIDLSPRPDARMPISGFEEIRFEIDYLALTGAGVQADVVWGPNSEDSQDEDVWQKLTLDPNLPGVPARAIDFKWDRPTWEASRPEQGLPSEEQPRRWSRPV